jgi:hypothetical protein
MIKTLLWIVIAVLLYLGAKEFTAYWDRVRKDQAAEDARRRGEPPPDQPAAPQALPGMPAHLESSLAAASNQGADGLRAWLNQNRRQVHDPRLAAIELDYVVLVAGKNFGEAKDVFASVKGRTPTNSPVYPRIKKLEKFYQ